MSDEYKDALFKLVKVEVITPAAVKRITGLDLDEPTKEIKEAATLLHTMICTECGKGCDFIHEEQFDDPWRRPDHKYWLSKARNVASARKLSDKDLLFAITRAVSGMESVSSFSQDALILLMRFIRAHLRQAQKAATAPAHKDDQVCEPSEEASDQESD